MVTKAWIILLVDRADLHRPQGCVSRSGRRTRHLRRAMLFGSEKGASAYIRKRTPRRRAFSFANIAPICVPPLPWNSRWLPVPTEVRIDTGESITALLDVHMELR